jgi:hypothetical protein
MMPVIKDTSLPISQIYISSLWEIDGYLFIVSRVISKIKNKKRKVFL